MTDLAAATHCSAAAAANRGVLGLSCVQSAVTMTDLLTDAPVWAADQAEGEEINE